MIAPADTQACSPEQHAEILRHVRLGRLFELMDWVADGLKVEITPEIWFKFLRKAGWRKPEKLAEIWHWRPDPEKTLLANPELAAELTTSILEHLDGWWRDFETKNGQAERLKACEYFAHLGVPFLITKEEHEIRSLRKAFGKTQDTEALARLFWVIHERGDEEQRARLKEIVRTPKMLSIIRKHDPFLLRDLGLGPQGCLQSKSPNATGPGISRTTRTPARLRSRRKRRSPNPFPSGLFLTIRHRIPHREDLAIGTSGATSIAEQARFWCFAAVSGG